MQTTLPSPPSNKPGFLVLLDFFVLLICMDPCSVETQIQLFDQVMSHTRLTHLPDLYANEPINYSSDV